MPTKPQKPCSYPGCPNLSGKMLCPDHRRDYEQRRGSRHDRGYTNRWLRYRASFLKRHPLCVLCAEQGRVSEATEVDHILSAASRPDLFWSSANHQALCKSCHSRKTMREGGGH